MTNDLFVIISLGDFMKRFTMKDEGFICKNCGKEVFPLDYTARDHCPHCLCSLHVDILPGDRKNTCHGILRPIGIEKYRDTFKIIYKCDSCGKTHKNIMANDDNMDLIIKLSNIEN